MQFNLPQPLIASILQYMCTHPIDPFDIHLLRCIHGNEHMGTHDVIHNIFATIMQDVGFRMGQKQLHAHPSTTFNSSHQRVNIVLIKDDIRTLTNTVIVNPT
jgi:hypothetical protein